MITIALLREGKVPPDNRVALTPAQCKWIHKNAADVRIIAQASPDRCYTNKEYLAAGVEVVEDISVADIFLGIKEALLKELVPGKTFLFFSHTKKQQPYNRDMFRAILDRKITL